jgi:hypothetical protein
MSFSIQGRNSLAKEIASGLVDELLEAAGPAGRDPRWWLRPYAIGFVWRHAFFGYEKARSEFWNGWFQTRTPSDAYMRELFLASACGKLPIGNSELEAAFDEVFGPSANPVRWPEFERGVGDADPLLHVKHGDGVRVETEAGQRVREWTKEFRDTGSSFIARGANILFPEKTYVYLVRRTLEAETANRVTG